METINKVLPFLSDKLYGLKNENGEVLVNPFFSKIETENFMGNPMVKVTLPNGSSGYLDEYTRKNIVSIFLPTTSGEYMRCDISKNGYLTSGISKSNNNYWLFVSVENGKFGIMDCDQNIIIPPHFSSGISSNNYAL